VRVGVTDCGGPEQPQVVDDPAGERGRGLLLVTGLSLRTGTHGNHQGRLVWADVRWDGPGPGAGAVMPRTAPARGRRGEPGHPAASVQCQTNNAMPRSA